MKWAKRGLTRKGEEEMGPLLGVLLDKLLSLSTRQLKLSCIACGLV
jgi:hypothetical protein